MYCGDTINAMMQSAFDTDWLPNYSMPIFSKSVLRREYCT